MQRPACCFSLNFQYLLIQHHWVHSVPLSWCLTGCFSHCSIVKPKTQPHQEYASENSSPVSTLTFRPGPLYALQTPPQLWNPHYSYGMCSWFASWTYHHLAQWSSSESDGWRILLWQNQYLLHRSCEVMRCSARLIHFFFFFFIHFFNKATLKTRDADLRPATFLCLWEARAVL